EMHFLFISFQRKKPAPIAKKVCESKSGEPLTCWSGAGVILQRLNESPWSAARGRRRFFRNADPHARDPKMAAVLIPHSRNRSVGEQRWQAVHKRGLYLQPTPRSLPNIRSCEAR